MDPENKSGKYEWQNLPGGVSGDDVETVLSAGLAIAIPRYSKAKFDAAMRSLKEQAEIVRRQMETVKKVKEASDVVKEE